MPEYFLVAKITSTFGREGFLNIISYSDFPVRFSELKEVFIDFYGNKKPFFVEEIKHQKNGFLLKVKNFDSDKVASALVNKEIFIIQKDLVKLPENSFYIHDLIGSKVYRDNLELGTIVDVLTFPANDVYVINDVNGKELLFPAVLEFIEKFDPLKKILVVKPGTGIYEDDEN